MQNPFGRKPVPENTKNELRRRGSKEGIAWNAKRFPWVVLTSLCSECSDTGEFTVLSSVKGPLYETGYIRPLPTIQSVDVKKQGELGTTRRVTVKLTAYTDQQLIGLQKCFFLPQMGVRIEWGWSIDTQNRPAPAILGQRKLTDSEAACEMKKKEKNNPHYSGLQGIVANFGYSLTTDNYWDCTLEVIAAAEPLSQAKVNTFNCGCKRENEINNEQGKTEKVVRVEPDIQVYLRDIQENFNKCIDKYPKEFEPYANGASIIIQQRTIKNMPQRNEAGGEATIGWGQWIGQFYTGKQSYEGYISWGTLESMINFLALDLNKNKNKTTFLGQVSSSDLLLPYHTALESSDPQICFIPGTNFATETSEFEKGNPEKNALVSDTTGKVKVKLENIMVNVIFLLGELRAVDSGNGGLVQFLMNVLNKISYACGNLWSFEIVSTTEVCQGTDTKQAPTISCIDIKIYEPAEVFEVNTLPIATTTNGVASAVRDFKLEMTMTDAMKTQALYSGGPIAKIKSPSGGNCDSEAFKAFNSDVGRAYNLAKGAPPTEIASNKCGCNEGELQATEDLSYDSVFRKMIENGPSPTNVTACRTSLIESYNLTDQDFVISRILPDSSKFVGSGANREHCKGVPLPFNFSFTVDGIGGFEFGQMVSSDRIPPQIRKNFEWQITTVEHSITVNDWTTNVNTVCRYKG